MADIEFFFDPVCPWAWITSRWVDEVVRLRDLDVEWRLIALRLVNEERDYDRDFAAGYERGHMRGLELLRVAAAARDAHGPAALGPLYTAIGTTFHDERGRDTFDDPERATTRAALAAAGLPDTLADAATEDVWDKVIRADTDEALTRTGRDVGTPIITWGPPDGPSLFGPVIARIPRGDEALALWDACATLARTKGFAELKRSDRDKPDFS